MGNNSVIVCVLYLFLYFCTARSLRLELWPSVVLYGIECCATQGHSSCPTERDETYLVSWLTSTTALKTLVECYSNSVLYEV
jgi:hypothetical protein